MRGLFFSNLFPSRAMPNCGSFSAKQLASCTPDVEFEVYVPTPWRTYRRFERDLWTGQDDFSVSYFPYFYTPGILRSKYGAFIHAAAKRQYAKMQRFEPDFILGSFVYPDGFAAMRIAQDLDIPFAVQALGSDIKVHARSPARRMLIRETLQNADHVYAVSDDLAHDIVELGVSPDKVTVNYNGVDQDIFQIRSKTDSRERIGFTSGSKKLILFVGNLIDSKGIMELVETCSHLVKLGESVHVLFVGTGASQRKLQSRVTEFGLESNVSLAGYVPNTELPHWFAAADVFCLPSYSEGVPNVIMEAIACGTPVVASKVGGIPEIVRSDNGILVKPQSVKSLAHGLRESLNREWHGENVRSTVAEFTWERYGETLVNGLRSIGSPASER